MQEMINHRESGESNFGSEYSSESTLSSCCCAESASHPPFDRKPVINKLNQTMEAMKALMSELKGNCNVGYARKMKEARRLALAFAGIDLQERPVTASENQETVALTASSDCENNSRRRPDREEVCRDVSRCTIRGSDHTSVNQTNKSRKKPKKRQKQGGQFSWGLSALEHPVPTKFENGHSCETALPCCQKNGARSKQKTQARPSELDIVKSSHVPQTPASDHSVNKPRRTRSSRAKRRKQKRQPSPDRSRSNVTIPTDRINGKSNIMTRTIEDRLEQMTLLAQNKSNECSTYEVGYHEEEREAKTAQKVKHSDNSTPYTSCSTTTIEESGLDLNQDFKVKEVPVKEIDKNEINGKLDLRLCQITSLEGNTRPWKCPLDEEVEHQRTLDGISATKLQRSDIKEEYAEDVAEIGPFVHIKEQHVEASGEQLKKESSFVAPPAVVPSDHNRPSAVWLSPSTVHKEHTDRINQKPVQPETEEYFSILTKLWISKMKLLAREKPLMAKIAEKLINDALFEADMEVLTAKSSINTPTTTNGEPGSPKLHEHQSMSSAAHYQCICNLSREFLNTKNKSVGKIEVGGSKSRPAVDASMSPVSNDCLCESCRDFLERKDKYPFYDSAFDDASPKLPKASFGQLDFRDRNQDGVVKLSVHDTRDKDAWKSRLGHEDRQLDSCHDNFYRNISPPPNTGTFRNDGPSFFMK